MTQLRSIVYVSSATQPFDAAELENLLVEARRANRQNGITGVLLFNDGNIIQCIEGPEDALSATYRRIRASTRHTDLIELLNEPVAGRCFADWQMALVEPTASQLLALTTARWQQLYRQEEGTEDLPAAFGLLRLFWRSARR